MAQYNFSITGTTPNKCVNPTTLEVSIENSAITIALDYISTADDIVSVFFKAELSESEQGILLNIISNHDGNLVIQPNTGPELATEATLIRIESLLQQILAK